MFTESNKTILGAYYYLWWGRPTYPILGGGIWRTSGACNEPILGKYNSREESVINQHLDWAKLAGIDFFAVNWNDIESWDDIALRDFYLKNPRSSETKFCIFYDSIPALNRYRFNVFPSYDFDQDYSPGRTKGEKFLEDFEYLEKNYFSRQNYLKIGGKPVVIIYDASAFRNIKKYFEKLPSLFLVADAVCYSGIKISWKNLLFPLQNPPKETLKVVFRALRRLNLKNYEADFSLSKYFSAITGYNLYHPSRTNNFLNNLDKLYQKFSRYSRSQGIGFIPNVMPGYDDRKLNGFDRPVLEREEGDFYKKFWEIAKKYADPKLNLALVTSFNEWHEGSELEPSREHGAKYLELTKKYC